MTSMTSEKCIWHHIAAPRPQYMHNFLLRDKRKKKHHLGSVKEIGSYRIFQIEYILVPKAIY